MNLNAGVLLSVFETVKGNGSENVGSTPISCSMEDDLITIEEANFNNGVGKIAVFNFIGSGDPVQHLNDAIVEYVGQKPYNEFIDMNMDNPWIRIVTIMNFKED